MIIMETQTPPPPSQPTIDSGRLLQIARLGRNPDNRDTITAGFSKDIRNKLDPSAREYNPNYGLWHALLDHTLGENHPMLQGGRREQLANQIVQTIDVAGLDRTDRTLPLDQMVRAYVEPLLPQDKAHAATQVDSTAQTVEPPLANRPPEWPADLNSPSFERRGGLSTPTPTPPAETRPPITPNIEIPTEAKPWPPTPNHMPPGPDLPFGQPSEAELSSSGPSVTTPMPPWVQFEGSTRFPPTTEPPAEVNAAFSQGLPPTNQASNQPEAPQEPWPLQNVLQNLREETHAEMSTPLPEMPASIKGATITEPVIDSPSQEVVNVTPTGTAPITSTAETPAPPAETVNTQATPTPAVEASPTTPNPPGTIDVEAQAAALAAERNISLAEAYDMLVQGTAS